jgi:PAS domain S-box-containing protein
MVTRPNSINPAEERAAESESWLRTVFETAPDGYYLHDMNGIFLDGNAATEAISGYARAELVGKSFLEVRLLPPHELPRAIEALSRALAGESTGPSEYTLIRKSGAELPVEIRTFPTQMDGRSVVVGCMRDLTQRKRTEQDRQARLRRTHRLQAAILEMATHEAVAAGDLEGAARCLAKQSAEALNLDSASIWLERAGKSEVHCLACYETAADRFVEGLTLGMSAEYFAALRNRQATISRTCQPGAEGSQPEMSRLDVPIQISAKTAGLVRHDRVRGPEPNAWESEEIRFAIEMADLIAIAILNSERQAALAEMRRSKASLDRAQRMAALCNWEVDLRDDSLECSPEMYHIFGLTSGPNRLNRADFLDKVHPEDRAAVDENMREVIRTGKASEVTLRIVRPDGSQRFLREHAEVEFDAAGAPLRAIGTLQDITEYKQLERRSISAHRMETVGRLAGGVAHDFNNLLTVINGYSEMLLNRVPEDSPLRKGLVEIRKAGENAADLTRQLLVFSRKQVIERRVLDLNAVVRELESMLRRLIGENIELRAILDEVPAVVEADASQLQQVVMNLVINARDAMPQGGRIAIETSTVEAPAMSGDRDRMPAGTYVLLAVSDTGIGMDENTRSQIFEPFFTTKEQGRGTGLGMATVYGIVKQNHGWIWVYSEPQMGTTIKVYLPSVNAAQNQDNERQSPDGPLTALEGRETILLVEDQEAVRQVTAALLEERGYRVWTASNGPEALEFCKTYRGRIDLAITDVVMPGCSGRDLADRLQAAHPRIKVLFMSGYTEYAAALQADLSPQRSFIEKPFAPQALAAKVRQCLEHPRTPATILVVDDEAPIRALLRDILGFEGYRVIEAVNGREAIELARTGMVDLVVTDLVMPEQEGIETITQLHRELPWLPLIAMSGAFGGEYLGIAKVLGARATLLKPIDPAALAAAIHHALETPRPASSGSETLPKDNI